MITGFLICCRPFIWFLIVAFAICSIPHFELLPEDPNGDTIQYGYDTLNRPMQKTPSKGAKTDYTYDTTSNGKGKLSSMARGDVADSIRGYDALGRVMKRVRTRNAFHKNFETSYTYDFSGKVAKLTYPTGHTPKTKKVIDVTSPMFLAGATLTGVGVGVFLVGLVIIIPTLIAMFKVLAATNFVSKGVPFIKAIFITGLISMPISSIMFMAGIPTLAVSIAKSPDVEKQAEPFLLQDIARNVLWQGIVKHHILG